jgi:phospholipid/cholesterol/gamma-HCH transport system permease protein
LFAIPVGWLGGALVSAANSRIAVGFNAFFQDLRQVVVAGDVLNGVFKSFVFALAIGIISCHQGLITRGGPRGIGRSVTKAVVNSIVCILVLDYFLTRVLLYIQK